MEGANNEAGRTTCGPTYEQIASRARKYPSTVDAYWRRYSGEASVGAENERLTVYLTMDVA